MTTIRVMICWSQISGYMAACWRELANQTGIDLAILAFRSGQPGTNAAFTDDVTAGLPIELLSAQQRDNTPLITQKVLAHRPEIVVVPGWLHGPYMNLTREPGLRRTKFIMGLDTPWRGTCRQKLARFRLAFYLKRIDRVICAGERSWQYARALGIPQSKLCRGLYGVDYVRLRPLHERRLGHGDWPKRFLYIGRYAPEKGLDVLIKGYLQYRRSVHKPWPLTCCGAGPSVHLLEGIEGIQDRGFVQPTDMGDILADHGVFLIASRFDPWPLVIVESCAAGLPVVCTEACGSSVELVRSYYNGLSVATEDVAAISTALCWMHRYHERLPEMGRRGQQLASAYSAQAWREQWLPLLRQLSD